MNEMCTARDALCSERVLRTSSNRDSIWALFLGGEISYEIRKYILLVEKTIYLFSSKVYINYYNNIMF